MNKLMLFLGACALLLLSSCQQVPKQPNVIFVLADDLGWRDLGCYGSDLYETPNLDALAEEGINFETAALPMPIRPLPCVHPPGPASLREWSRAA